MICIRNCRSYVTKYLVVIVVGERAALYDVSRSYFTPPRDTGRLFLGVHIIDYEYTILDNCLC
jgi:hypothetical protein